MKLLSSTSLAAAALVLLTADAAKYKTCTEQERQSVFGGLTNELKSCSTTSTYDLTSNTLPTSTQRQAVCKCSDLIKRLGDLSLPRCNLVLDGSSLSFKDAVSSVFTTCAIGELKEVPATLAPGDNSTDTTASDDTVAGEASLPSSASKSQGSASSSGSDLAIETTKPTTTPKPTTTTPKPTAAAKNSSSNTTAATPTPAPASGATSVVASASLSVVVALAAYVSL
ncbi:hypothetical protein Gpo141_00005945 [Globisporangium polare]